MYINRKEKFLVYTNFFLLFPLIISIESQNVGTSVLIGLVIIFSTMFHVCKKPGAEWWWHTIGRSSVQTLLLIAELLLSTTLAIWSGLLLLQKHQPLLILGVLILFIPSFILFLSTNYKRYVLYHSIWHIVVSVILCLAII